MLHQIKHVTCPSFLKIVTHFHLSFAAKLAAELEQRRSSPTGKAAAVLWLLGTVLVSSLVGFQPIRFFHRLARHQECFGLQKDSEGIQNLGERVSDTAMDNQAASSEERNGDIVRRRRRTHGLQVRATDSPVSPPRRSVTLSRSTPPVDNRAPLHVTRRIHAYPTSHLQRHRLRRQREDDALGTVQDAVNRLNEVTSNLTSVLDEPLPQILGPDEFTGLIDDMDGYNRRSKRRKLDADPLDPQTSFSYGYHGQVTPGRLKMTINSCDGGHLTDTEELLPERNYNPENVLRNDKSVYCSKKDRCNMVLKHWGETPFTVTKMIIKAPDCGFTAP